MSRFTAGYDFNTRRCKPWSDRDANECDLALSVRPGFPLARVVGALRKLAAFVEKQPDPNEAEYRADNVTSTAPVVGTRRGPHKAAAVG